MPDVLVLPARLSRWLDNFRERHGATGLTLVDGSLRGRAEDGAWFEAVLPFEQEHAGRSTPEAFAEAATPPDRWGVLLVRKGGFAIARMSRDRVAESKVGRRHVQGRTKAGGQSQQRFARRRANQARAAFDAAADHAARILGGVELLVTGGDRAAVAEVLADPRLAGGRVVAPWLAVPDPRRAVLEQAIRDAQAIRVRVDNASA